MRRIKHTIQPIIQPSFPALELSALVIAGKMTREAAIDMLLMARKIRKRG